MEGRVSPGWGSWSYLMREGQATLQLLLSRQEPQLGVRGSAPPASVTPLPTPVFQPASWQWQWDLENVALALGSPWSCCAMCQGHCPQQADMLRTPWAGRWHLRGHLGLAAWLPSWTQRVWAA